MNNLYLKLEYIPDKLAYNIKIYLHNNIVYEFDMSIYKDKKEILFIYNEDDFKSMLIKYNLKSKEIETLIETLTYKINWI